jgi:hypothetical protein
MPAVPPCLKPILSPGGDDPLLNPNQASQVFTVTPATIRKWAQLGKIAPAGLDPEGRKLYRRNDIARYELKTRRSSGRENRDKKLMKGSACPNLTSRSVKPSAAI